MHVSSDIVNVKITHYKQVSTTNKTILYIFSTKSFSLVKKKQIYVKIKKNNKI